MDREISHQVFFLSATWCEWSAGNSQRKCDSEYIVRWRLDELIPTPERILSRGVFRVPWKIVYIWSLLNYKLHLSLDLRGVSFVLRDVLQQYLQVSDYFTETPRQSLRTNAFELFEKNCNMRDVWSWMKMFDDVWYWVDDSVTYLSLILKE